MAVTVTATGTVTVTVTVTAAVTAAETETETETVAGTGAVTVAATVTPCPRPGCYSSRTSSSVGASRTRSIQRTSCSGVARSIRSWVAAGSSPKRRSMLR